MKKLILYLLSVIPFYIFGQAPNGISFQAVVRNSEGEVISNQQIQVRLSILKGSNSDPTVYSEIHTPTTNESGLFSLTIGQGVSTTGTFVDIDWSAGDLYLKREIDPNNNSTYPIVGTSQFLTIPYSFYSNVADSVISKQKLSISNDTIYLSDGGFAKLPSGFDGDYTSLTNKPTIPSNTSDLTNDSGFLTSEVDGSITNEIQTISKVDRTVTLSNDGGTFRDSILTEAQVDAYANNNGYLTSEVDGSITNEIQVLSISNDTIYLSDGGFAKLPDTIQDGTNNGQILYWNNDSWLNLPNGLPGQQLTIDENGLPKWTGDAYPTVTTVSTSSITATSVTVNVNISADGGQSVSSRGVVYNTSDNPTLSNSSQVSGSGTGSFNVIVNGLTPSTTYNIRGFGTNSVGTGYGNSLSFSTSAPTIPILSTNSVSSITQTSAVSGGVISSDGGSTVTSRGIVWSTSSNPTISNSKTTDGTGTGNFSSSLSGLSNNTTYYIRAYATNSVGTAYGNELNFTTSVATVPILTTNTVVNITNTSASSGGAISSDGGSAITAKGVVWSTNTNPTLLDNSTNDGTGNTGFNSVLTGLSAGITYYVRSYATNSTGTGYGNQVSFTTASTANTIATVILDSIGNLTTISATAYAEVTNEGGGAVTDRGIVWSNASSPTVFNNLITSGSGSGIYNVPITSGLQSNKTYYVKAYAVNNYGITYSNELTFTTLIGLATLSTYTMVASTETATSGGNITDDGGSSITSRGVVWSTSSSPTILDSKTIDGSGTGNFTSTLTGLMPSTTYYVRAYATNSTGTAYGEERSFTTASAPTTVTDIDGNVYNTVDIGGQIWLAENLKVSKYNDGTAIPYVVGDSEWFNLTTGAWVYYNHDENNNVVYGKLYNWYAVNTGKLCPTGWHVPSDTEWTTLITYLGGSNVAGGKLKSIGTTYWNSPNEGATNESGFTALPGGARYNSFPYQAEPSNVEKFGSLNKGGYWWSSTEDISRDRVFFYSLFWLYEDAIRFLGNKLEGFSIRCIKD